MTTILWRPPADVRQTSRIGDYLRWLSAGQAWEFEAYADVWQWSVDDLPGFWRSIWDYFDVVAHSEPTEILSGGYTMGAPFGPGTPFGPTGTWFPGARLNYAENVLRMPGVAGDAPIVLGRSQSREPIEYTADQLRDQVRRAAAGLRRLGVEPGDRVAAYLPNVPEALVLLLATASLGAIFTSCAPEFGTRSVTDRWTQISPVVLVAVDGYRYGDKLVDRRAEVAGIRAALPSVRATVGLDYAGQGLNADLSWAELTADTDEPLSFTPVAFDEPLYILYSSGTTGLPKPIVHGHGGILLEHLKMLALHHDLGPGDRMFWFSTTGWMMWNYLVSAPAVGSAIVMFDGNPGWPDLGALWRMAEQTQTTFFGTSAPFLLACRKAGLSPKDEADLSRLKGLGSTGAPLPPEGFRWVYSDVSDTLQLQSLSGGTDVCTGFVGSTPLNPVYEGEIAARCLGSRVEAYDPTGHPVLGELGELVISAPMPSMPVGFWGDDDGSRYREAYFDVFPGVWRHGDWVTITDHGSCVITGRSDATLNRGGVRLGTAEFYSVVEALDEVVDSVVVHLEDTEGGAGELLLFVVLSDGLELDDALRAKIARELRTALSPRHIPDAIYQVTAAPRTLSGKKLEVPVKRILTGTPVDRAAAKGALANPESLSAFEKLARDRPH
ncbi:acetoacetyl-CoA synthetase [Hamadaea flava]|uniref:Acetoacetate--CoA ligase n=1 Tax=Hamadaea flava TaxID=1742688 RepID=A0ABV8LG65_9ACTN|nr:acetoacetate--CoA ligase [Hamadaea flava]MCP2326669.1 acetoacetyl-CoA synthetase [Hamadaea flava]